MRTSNFVFGLSLCGIFLSAGGYVQQASATTQPQVHMIAPGQHPSVAANAAGKLFVAFEEKGESSNQTQIYCSVSSNAGNTWSKALRISHDTKFAMHPQIATEPNGAVDIVWSETDAEKKHASVFLARSSDDASSFSQPQLISGDGTEAIEPALVSGADGTLHIVYSDFNKARGIHDIFYTHSLTKAGARAQTDFADKVYVSFTPGNSTQPCIALDSRGNVHVAWSDDSLGPDHPDIWYASNATGSWSHPTNISHSPRVSTHPSIACRREEAFLVWMDNSRKEYAADIWFVKISRKGKVTHPINISGTPGVSSEAAIATGSNGYVSVVWADTSVNLQTPSVYGRVSLDAASDFSNVMNLSGKDTRYPARHPAVVIAGDRMYAVYEQQLLADKSDIKITELTLKGIATGPAMLVDPTLHGVSGNMH